MFEYKSAKIRLYEERRKNEALSAKLNQRESDIDYIAMMCDVELESGEETSDE